jgi:PAS domain S-box-containing protein
MSERDPEAVAGEIEPSADEALLRAQAEALLRAQAKNIIPKKSAHTEPSREQLSEAIHELQVHQIELELQNEELCSTQAALAESRENFVNLYNLAPVGYCTLNHDGLIVQSNLTLADMLGLPQEYLHKRNLNHFIHMQDRDVFYLEFRKAFKSFAADRDTLLHQCELRMIKSNAEPLWVLLTIVPAPSEGRDHDCHPNLRITLTDITERLASQQKSVNIQAALDQHAILVITDILGMITYVNDKMTEVSGYSREELIGKTHHLLKSGRHDQAFYSEMYLTITQGKTWQGEFCNKAKDGHLYWLQTTIVPFMGVDGKPESYLTIRTDVSERKLAEERWLFALEGNRDGVWDLNYQTGKVFFSHRWKAMLGYSDDDVDDSLDEWDKRIHPEDKARCYKDLNRHFDGETDSYENEHRILCKDSSYKWIVARGKVVEWSCEHKPLRVIGTHQDITERKRVEQSLMRAQKMDALGQLTGGIAHDFNNILGVIIGNLELLEMEIGDNPNAQRRFDAAQKAAQRAADLTKQLLGFSRLQVSQTAKLNINSIIQEMDELIGRSLTPQVTVIQHFEKGLWLTAINSGDLQDALLNLLLNARDAMPKGGQVILETKNAVLDYNYCRLHPSAKPGEYVQLNVSDTGKGIAKVFQSNIFDPFFTTKPKDLGTGLGLSMVFGFVRRSGGYICVDSELKKGTTFTLYLPRVHGEEQAMPVGVDPADARLAQGHEIILIVDDELELLNLAEHNLECLGYRVITAINGQQALERLAQNPEIDLLFSDVVMPGGINGYQLAGQACSLSPALKVLLTTGFTEDKLVSDDLEHFSANVLSKPYTRTELANRVRKLLDPSETPNGLLSEEHKQ